MSYRIQLHPLALAEIEGSYNWYEERSVGLGVRFLEAIQDRVDRVELMPELFARKHGKYREVLVDGFPFTIIYNVLVKPKIVFVSYIFHTKRNPLLKCKR